MLPPKQAHLVPATSMKHVEALMELLLQVGLAGWGRDQQCSWPALTRPAAMRAGCKLAHVPAALSHTRASFLQNNKIRAATHNIMAYRIEQAERGTFLQVCRRRRPMRWLLMMVLPVAAA